MNKIFYEKKQIIGASLVLLGLLYFVIQLMPELTKNTSLITELINSEGKNPVKKTLEFHEIEQDDEKEKGMLFNFNAKTNKEAEKAGLRFYNNFFDELDRPSQFIPFFVDGYVVGISIFREFDLGEKRLGVVADINENWNRYPPLSRHMMLILS